MSLSEEAATTLEEPSKEEKAIQKFRAVEVLRDTMNFHHNQAQDVILGIIVLLKADPKSRGDLLTHMHKQYEKARDIAIDCAAKLAPFESPKLQSMEVKQETIHRFVVRSPTQALTTEDWMKNTGATRAITKTEEPVELPQSDYADYENIEEVEIDNKTMEHFTNSSEF